MEEKTIQVEKKVYVASDGQEFENKRDCEWHEEDMAMQARKQSVAHLQVKDMPEWPSLLDLKKVDAEVLWFRITNDEELKQFLHAYSDWFCGEEDVFSEVRPVLHYPDFLCLADFTRLGVVTYCSLSQFLEKQKQFMQFADQSSSQTISGIQEKGKETKE